MRWWTLGLVLVACAPPAALQSVEVRPRRTPREAHQQPPIRGGTLLVTRDGRTAVASDPDRDSVWLLSVTHELSVRERVDLEPGDEPWRIAEDGRGRVHVTLRGSGRVATIDLDDGSLIARRPVCTAPAGLTWDRADQRLIVACGGGEVMGVEGGRVYKIDRLAPDLRDVWIATGAIGFSRFRSAEVVSLDEAPVLRPPAAQLPIRGDISWASATYGAAVAWRTVPDPEGGAWMLHQRQRETPFNTRAPVMQYYGNPGNGRVVKPAITYIGPDGIGLGGVLEDGGVLPVDLAPSPDGTLLALAYAGHGGAQVITSPRLSRRMHATVLGGASDRAVGVGWSGRRVITQLSDPPRVAMYQGDDAVLLSAVPLDTPAARHPGRDIFHQATATDIACASCHPEAGDDGFVWIFEEDRFTRTPSLTGGVTPTAPFHWSGEHQTMEDLLHAVFEVRMGGRDLTDHEMDEVGDWLDAQPAPTFEGDDPAAVARGRRLFHGARTECARCHAGEALTDNESYDVGTGGTFQTPTLRGLRWRAPYFHNGCARTLEERFDRCHSEGHGDISGLSRRDISDLVAYLGTL